jgi:glucose/arabinose dehydrogenase
MKRNLLILVLIMLPAFAGACSGGGGGSTMEPPPPAAPADLTLAFSQVASGLASPTVITHAGDGSGRLFLVEQPGTIRIVRAGILQAEPFLDISERLVVGGERGLLGLAFPPDFAAKGYFYVNYTRAGDGATVVSRFLVSPDNPDLALADQEEVILVVEQPFANHNGGQLAFGPDGFLYVALGDGGSGGDPQGHGQNLATLLGSILRIDVENGEVPYRVPPDNPYVDNPNARDEIWASGLRNPWRFSFDRLNGDLFLADVGQNTWEEINFQSAGAAGGANYGWNILEGHDCFSPATGCAPPSAYAAPIFVYGHSLGCSVTGGYVYRGSAIAALAGDYVFGDFCSGRLWRLRRAAADWEAELVAETDFRISTFGEDETGELYLADYLRGVIYRLDPS